MESLAVFLFNSVGASLRALNLEESVRVVECSALGDWGLLIVAGDWNILSEYHTKILPEGLLKSTLIRDVDPYLLKAFYSLENANIDACLVSLESDYIGDLFEEIDRLLKTRSFKIVDFRMARGLRGQSYALLTGEAMSLRNLTSTPTVKVTIIEEPNLVLRQFFNLSPKN